MRFGHGAKARELTDGEAVGAVAIVEAVAEGHHQAWLLAAEQQGEAIQRGVGVPRRQELAVAGVGGAFLQMEVRYRQQIGGRPVQRTGRIEHQPLSGEVDGSGGHWDHDPLSPTPSRKGRGEVGLLPPPLAGGGWREGAGDTVMN